MTTTEIKKLMKLLDERKLDELETELKVALVKAGGDKKQISLIQRVKKYFSQSKKEIKARPTLGMVQCEPNGKKTITDGYCAVRWNNPPVELETLPEEKINPLNFESIIPSNLIYTNMTDEEKIIFNNLDTYITLNNFDNQFKMMKINGKYYDARLVKKVLDVIGTDVTITREDANLLNFYNKDMDVTAMVLPVRVTNVLNDEELAELNKNINDLYFMIVKEKGGEI